MSLAALAAIVAALTIAPGVPAQAAPSRDKRVFAPPCPDPKIRLKTKCLNPTAMRGLTLTGNATTVAIGQQLQFTLGAAPLCPATPRKPEEPACSVISWYLLYGASVAQWGVGSILQETIGTIDRVGCTPASFTCRFKVWLNPDADQAQIDSVLPDGAALRVTAGVVEYRTRCAGGECHPVPVNGGTLDWPLTFVASDQVTLSGTMRTTDCTGATCRRKGVAGQRLTVAGSTASGVKRKLAATSTADGTWKVRVPKGEYTVTPTTKSFVPENRKVVARRNVAGLDFASCGKLPGTLSPREANGSTGCPDGLGWKMHSRVTQVPKLVKSTANNVLPAKDVYFADGLIADLFPTVQGSRLRSCGTSSWHWTVPRTGIPAGAKVLSLGSRSGGQGKECGTLLKVSKPGTYTVVAEEFIPFKAKAHRRLTQQVVFKDLLILGIGDSNGSGEGTAGIFFPQCNRGTSSYQYQAARQLETLSKGHASATFVFASCSGAVTSHLGTHTYAGIIPGAALQPQLLQIAKAIRNPAGGGPARKADALMVSTGVNDLSFGPILSFCIQGLPLIRASYPLLAAVNCEDLPVTTTQNPITGVTSGFIIDPLSSLRLRDHVGLAVNRLPETYAALSAALAATPVVKPAANVYLSQYPAFWYEANGAVCGTTPVPSVLEPATWKWLGEQGTALNRAIVTAQRKHGWSLVPVPEKAFWGHGYCTASSYFVSIEFAKRSGNINGAFHPTAVGAKVTADAAAREMCKRLGPGTCGRR